jgi:hypothetical protein
MNVVLAAIDAAATPGKLQILTAADALLVEIELNDPSATVSPAGVLTLAGVPLSGVASGTGTAAKAQILDGDDNAVVTGLTVGVGTGDVQLDSVSITTGQTVTITSGTITHG